MAQINRHAVINDFCLPISINIYIFQPTDLSNLAKKYPDGLTEEQLRQGCIRCKENAKRLLKSASILLDHEDSQQYSLGLYMYAVEEYGKAILLKEQIVGGKIEYKIPKWIFESHDTKILEGFRNLPDTCRNISRGIRIKTNTDTKTRIIEISSNRKVAIGAGATGYFFDTVNSNSFKQDIELKTACFYVNWDKRNGTWKYDIVTDIPQLKDNIEHFRNALDKFKCI